MLYVHFGMQKMKKKAEWMCCFTAENNGILWIDTLIVCVVANKRTCKQIESEKSIDRLRKTLAKWP